MIPLEFYQRKRLANSIL